MSNDLRTADAVRDDSPRAASPTADVVTIDLEIGGMTCASCANRVERKLARLPGVEASVNYATEKARVSTTADTDVSELIAAVESAGYTAAVAMAVRRDSEDVGAARASEMPSETDALRNRLLISAALALPVLLMSMIPALQFDNWQWLSLTLAAPVAVWGAWPFHRAAWINARHGAATMDTLISVGVAAAFLWSLYALFFGMAGMAGMRMSLELITTPGSGGHEIYLEVAAVVTVFILAGRYIEARAKRDSGAALRALLELGAKNAMVMRGGTEVSVAVDALVVGDRFVVRPGEKVATDGLVVEGASAIDKSLVTGESVPVDVTVGDRIVGATLNVGGRLVVEVTRVGADTELARLGRLVEEAQTGKAAVQRLADRVAAVFVPVVFVLAIGTFVAWALLGPSLETAFTAAVATLIIACPCALGLATPTALLVGTGRGSQLGILIRGPQVLEQTRRIDTIVLDKTGTITRGELVVSAMFASAPALTGSERELEPELEPKLELLRLAASAEHGSEHPIARSIVAEAGARGLTLSPVDSFASDAGAGVRATIGDRLVAVGRASWLAAEWALEVPHDLQQRIAAAEASGSTPIVVAADGAVLGVIVVDDEIKSTSADAVQRFIALGLTPVLLTGDNSGSAAAVAQKVGISRVLGGVTPAGKLDAIRELQAAGHVVAMVGDGVNDAAALAAADLGIAMGQGTDAAIAASDITVLSGDLVVVGDAVRLARRTLGTIKGNLFWAFLYNVIALPVAMLGLLSPLVAGAAMALSSVFVVTNSLRLRGFRGTSSSISSAAEGHIRVQ